MIYSFNGFIPVVHESAFVHPQAAVTGNVIIGRNVYTVTNYSGLDPENGSVLSRLEDNVYPQVRTWTMAFNVSF